jgi:hypothetical protein
MPGSNLGYSSTFGIATENLGGDPKSSDIFGGKKNRGRRAIHARYFPAARQGKQIAPSAAAQIEQRFLNWETRGLVRRNVSIGGLL